MRWPWQRSGERGPDVAPPAAASPDAARPVPPAGWAFLPPLQRQVSDAAPATLRPAFIASLPTRTVPASLGAMGHLVDDRAPAGTIGVDDGALGAPVQRAVDAELTLGPGRGAPAQRGVPTQAVTRPVQRTTDAAGRAPSDEPAAAVDAPAAAVDADADAPLRMPLPADVPDRAADTDAPLDASPVGVQTAEPAGVITTGLVGGGLSTPVSRLLDESAASADAGSRASTAAESGVDGARRGTATGPSSSPPPLVRPTVQRSTSVSGLDAPTDATSGHVDASPPAASQTAVPPPAASPAASSAPRRVGLGAPLPTRSLQRTVPPDAEDARPAPAIDDARQVPLIAETPLTPTISADAAAPTTSEAEPGDGPRAGTGSAAADVAASSAPLAWSPSPSVQRDASGVDGTSATASVAESPSVEPVGAAPTGDETTGAAPATGVEPLTGGVPSHADAASSSIGTAARGAPIMVQRSVALVAARRIVPALTLPAMGPRIAPRQGGPVVAARVVAPVPPPTAPGAPGAGAGPARGSAVSTPTGSPAATSHATIGTDGRTSIWGGSDGEAAGGETPWTPDEPAVVASVSRLSAPPSPSIGPVRPLTDRMPVAAAVQTVGSAGHRPVDLPTAVQRLAGLPSLGQLPLDVPEVGQLGSRAAEAAEAAEETASSATSGAASRATDALRDSADVVTKSAQALSPAAAAAPGGGPENVEQLVRKLYGPLIRRIKAELLLDRERRGIRIDGI
jgi:hypothetical protein